VEASVPNIEGNDVMHESDFWTNFADSMEMSIEGNRLIARELADAGRELWHRVLQLLQASPHGRRQHRHLPPV
jgi:hypothetical protein